MNEIEDLAAQTVQWLGSPVVKDLAKPVWNFIRRRFKSNGKVISAVDAVVADPQSAAAAKVLKDHLQMELERSPSFITELRCLLESERQNNYASQSASAQAGSTIVQIQGNNNRT